MTNDEQLQLWVDGKPTHMGAKEDRGSQCYPDFSFCTPELLQPVEVRRAFQAADEGARMKWLGVFLGAALATYKPGAKVDILTPERHEPS